MKKNKGITLIALIITVIVMLILAGVAISTLTGDNGLFSRVSEAKKISEISAIKEAIGVDLLMEQAENVGGNISTEQLENILTKYGTITYEEDGQTVKGIKTEEGYEILLSEIWSGSTVAETPTTPETPDTPDTTAPVINTIDGKTSEWATTDVGRTFNISSVTETDSGVDRYEYYINNVAPTTSTEGTSMGTTSSVTVKTAMTSKIYFRAIDKAGNIGEWVSGGDIKITGYDLNDYVAGSTVLLDCNTGKEETDGVITKWIDQSGKGNDAVASTTETAPVNAIDGGIYLDGTKYLVFPSSLYYPEVTMEVVLQHSGIQRQINSQAVSDIDVGGYCLASIENVSYNEFSAYKGTRYISAKVVCLPNVKYSISGRANFDFVKINQNYSSTSVINNANELIGPKDGEHMVIGGNPNKVAGETIIQGDWYTGTIYAIRIYDRVLTDDEVQKNYVIDKARHNII